MFVGVPTQDFIKFIKQNLLNIYQIAVLTYKVRKFATWYGSINNIKIERYGSRNNGIFRKA